IFHLVHSLFGKTLALRSPRRPGLSAHAPHDPLRRTQISTILFQQSDNCLSPASRALAPARGTEPSWAAMAESQEIRPSGPPHGDFLCTIPLDWVSSRRSPCG